MKFFNICGPINPNKHYYIAHRLGEQEVQQLIERDEYIVLHAPRQSGKTTFILGLVDRLNEEGSYKALCVNVQRAREAKDDSLYAIKLILNELYQSATGYFDKTDPIFSIIEKELAETLLITSLKRVLSAWSAVSDKPIVLFIDEIDTLIGEPLLSVLSEICIGYIDRPRLPFPKSICLIGLRDVRDYRIGESGGSPFNIAVSLTLSNFTQEQIADLYLQHTQETGQMFTDEAIAYVFYLTDGQPWLVNALAREACVLETKNPITKEIIEQAKEKVILKRDLHISQLVERLKEPRVYAIIGAIITGEQAESDLDHNDLQYVSGLGLLNKQKARFTNPMYQDIILREFSSKIKESLKSCKELYRPSTDYFSGKSFKSS